MNKRQIIELIVSIGVLAASLWAGHAIVLAVSRGLFSQLSAILLVLLCFGVACAAGQKVNVMTEIRALRWLGNVLFPVYFGLCIWAVIFTVLAVIRHQCPLLLAGIVIACCAGAGFVSGYVAFTGVMVAFSKRPAS